MKKRVEIKVNEEMYDFLEKSRIEKDFEDKQDYLVDLIQNEMKKEESFFSRLKKLFN